MATHNRAPRRVTRPLSNVDVTVVFAVIPADDPTGDGTEELTPEQLRAVSEIGSIRPIGTPGVYLYQFSKTTTGYTSGVACLAVEDRLHRAVGLVRPGGGLRWLRICSSTAERAGPRLET